MRHIRLKKYFNNKMTVLFFLIFVLIVQITVYNSTAVFGPLSYCKLLKIVFKAISRTKKKIFQKLNCGSLPPPTLHILPTQHNSLPTLQILPTNLLLPIFCLENPRSSKITYPSDSLTYYLYLVNYYLLCLRVV